MSKLKHRVEQLEKRTGCGQQKVHVIHWRYYEETEQEAVDRFLARNPGLKIRSEDLCVLIKQFGKIREVFDWDDQITTQPG